MSALQTYNCTKCPLHKVRKNIVWDAGASDADILIIGDFPTRLSDATGKIFDDDYGKEVKKTIVSAGMNSKNIHVSYLFNCLPPKEDIKSKYAKIALQVCPTNHLIPVIRKIQPKVVILLGQKIYNIFSGFFVSSDNESVPFEFKIVKTINPRDILQGDISLRRQLVDDFTLAQQLSNPIERYPQSHIVQTPAQFKSFVNEITQQSRIAFDTEGTSLNYFQNTVIGISFAWDWWNGYYIPLKQFNMFMGGLADYWDNQVEVISQLQSILEDTHISKAAHNYKYDRNVLKVEYGMDIDASFGFDSIVGAHIENELRSVSLTNLSKQFPDLYGYDDYLKMLVKEQEDVDFSKIPLQVLYSYGAFDALTTYRLSVKLVQTLQQREKQ